MFRARVVGVVLTVEVKGVVPLVFRTMGTRGGDVLDLGAESKF